jgi:hypothetical protein
MTNRPTVEVELISVTDRAANLTAWSATTATIDGHRTHSGVWRQPMVTVYDDDANAARTWHAHPGNPPVREDLWLKHGVVVDTAGHYYEPATGAIDGTWP